MAQTINIAVAGPRGKMGSEAIHMIQETSHFNLAGVIDHKHEGKMVADLPGLPELERPVYTDIDRCFSNETVDVLIDFTHPDIGKKHIQKAINYNIRPVIGTSGFTSEDVDYFTKEAKAKELGGMIAPNFAVGAVLMMKFSQMAAKYLPDVEIIEKHHDQKKDAPSGTAVKTAEMIHNNREEMTQGHPEEQELIQGARGAEDQGLRIHSVRLPGLVAHQEVIFGGDGQLLTVKHDSFNRKSFMSGVRYAVDTVMNLDTIVYGLDQIMD
ncbi:4-hydroxy-tetrahydrodipicolinate reductase [Tuberibacillus sp. Marseille-P3662]|uniref:4-hydroxy-tetrahydrodipicolinate reductase n=1 Tax=Tuberibacillus sp. Marseille-P3662 TaxID=1965358 RepID=UPI000A1CE183|nr:4-hydroxy-tetrahydrodipicolinate reductase [Tuberibacillus sp. Marseille-P3662]